METIIFTSLAAHVQSRRYNSSIETIIFLPQTLSLESIVYLNANFNALLISHHKFVAPQNSHHNHTFFYF